MHLLRYELLVTCSPTVCLEVEEYICHPYYFVLSIWIFRIIYLELFCLEERSIFVQFLDLHPHYFAFIYSQTLKNARLRSCAVRSIHGGAVVRNQNPNQKHPQICGDYPRYLSGVCKFSFMMFLVCNLVKSSIHFNRFLYATW